MADLTGQQLKDSYQNLVTIDATIESNPTSGQLENGLGNPITALGIGTDSPSANLHLSGTTDIGMRIKSGASALSYIDFDDADSGTPSGSIAYNHINDSMTFGTGGSNTERMRIDSSGNVGINATPENSAGTWRNFNFGSLSMAGRANNVNPDAIFGTNFKFTTANAEQRISAHATSRILFNDDVITFQNAGSGTAGSAISWSPNMTIDSSGNVGIGTTLPSVPLEVNVSGAGDVFKLTRDTGTNGELNIDFAGANANFASAQGGYTFTTSSVSSAMTIDSSGNVGIGETDPDSKLHLKSASAGLLELERTSVGAYRLAISLSDAFSIFDVAEGSDRLVIDSSGNVGINNTSPSSFLPNGNELVLGNGSASHGMTIFSDSSGTGNLFFADGTTGDEAYRGFLRYNHADDAMIIFTAGANERMRIASNGEVTIKGSNSSTHPALTLQNTHGAGGSQGSTKLEFSVINSIDTDVRSTIISRERTADSNLSELLFSVSDNGAGNPALAFTLTGGATAGDATFLRMASGTGGIQFNGDTATANALDDYEEGDWSPTFASSTPDATNPMSVTVDSGNSSGKYIKIGAQVTVFGRLQTDGITLNDDPSSDACVISGLPFVTSAKGSGSIGRVRQFTNAPDGIAVQLSVSHLNLQKSNQGADFTLGDLLDGSNKNSIFFNATYFTNS